MTTELPNQIKIVQTKAYRIRANIIDETQDFIFVAPLVFPEGPDWESLNAETIQLNSVEIELKPYYNFATMAANGMGKISGDYPIYGNFFVGNTAGEDDGKVFSKYILSGKYARGSATTGVKATYGSTYYKTVFAKTPEEGTTNLGDEIVNKENSTTTIDDTMLESSKIVLQKGRVVICLRKKDFVIDEECLLTKGNEAEDSHGSGKTIIKYLKAKKGFKQPTSGKEVPMKVKKSKKSGNPGGDDTKPDMPLGYVEDPVWNEKTNQWELILDFPFWLVATYDISYSRKS